MRLIGPSNSSLFRLLFHYPAQSFRSKKSKVQSHNLAGAILSGLMPVTTEDEPEDIDDDSPSRVCGSLFLSLLNCA